MSPTKMLKETAIKMIFAPPLGARLEGAQHLQEVEGETEFEGRATIPSISGAGPKGRRGQC